MADSYDEVEFNDYDPTRPISAARMRPVARQYHAVAQDAGDPDTTVGAAIRAVAVSVGGGISYTDNGDGTLTLGPTGAFVDNGDGTITIGA